MKRVLLICSVVAAFAGCSDPQSPGVEYMPDMYRSPSIEAYEEEKLFADHSGARMPAEGSIPRGFMPYQYENTTEGYEMAGKELKNPLPYSEDLVSEGKEIYGKFCVHCHGKKGKGDGAVASNPKWPGPPPAYDGARLKDLPAGKIFHSITYGKGLMGPHAGQINQEDRWKLVYYVQTLQGKDLKAMQAEAGSDQKEMEEENKEDNNTENQDA